MDIRAHLRYLRVAPRKVRLVVDLVRGLPIPQAIEQLQVLPKRSSLPLKKLIESAVANAVHNHKLQRDALVIKSFVVNEGPRLKRYRPRAFGRAAVIQKRMSHVSIVLTDQRPTNTKPTTATNASSKLPTSAVKQSRSQPSVPTTRPSKLRTESSKAVRRQAEDPRVTRSGAS